MSAAAKILVVDDTPANIKLLGDLLASKGYAVCTATNGEEGLARLAAEKPDLVLLDVMMPGISGYDVCRRIRADPATALLPVVMCTSLDPQQERVKGIEAGADDFLSKPVNQPELFARVKSLLRVKALHDEITTINASLEKRVAEQVAEIDRLARLKRFVSPRVGEMIVSGEVDDPLKTHRREITVVFTDLRGFTALSESLPAEQLLSLLNDYFENCAAAAAARGGEILQFIGDAILIVFEIRDRAQEAKVCNDALDAAIDALDAMAVTNHRRKRAGYAQIEFGLGLHLGEVTHANVGAPGRLAFNVIGPAVNKTARIQGLTKEAGVPLLLSREFAAHIQRPLRPVGTFDLRGVAGSHEVFTPAPGAEKEL